jgi:hypothetical protein
MPTIFVFALSLIGAAVSTSAAEVAAPQIQCQEATYDFGSRDASESVEHTFILNNTGSADLEIKKVQPACGCTTAELEKNIIPPGDSAKIAAKLSLAGRTGELQKPINIESNDPTNPTLQLAIKGIVGNEFQVTPPILVLHQPAQGEPATGSVQITSHGKPFRITKVESSDSSIIVRADPLPDGLSHQISAALEKIPDSDPQPFLITLQTDNPRKPTVEISATIVLKKKIIIAPDRITLRNGDEGAKKYVVIKSADGAPLEIKEILTPDPAVKVDYSTTPSSIRLTVRGLPASREYDGKAITIAFFNGESVQIPVVFKSL